MYLIHCDASIEPINPGGILVWAFIAKHKGKVVHQDVHISGWGKGCTNNRGEMEAVLAAMLWLIGLPKKDHHPAIIYSDSQLIINQCSGKWGCHADNLVPMLNLINRAVDRYNKTVFFKWIPREKNTEADALSRTLYTEKALKLFKENEMDIWFEGDDVPW
jgi:ribonuclease HI